MEETDANIFNRLATEITQLYAQPPSSEVIPSEATLEAGRRKLVSELPSTGMGLEQTIRHIQEHLVPALNASSRSPTYYGFITGGSTPAATLADNLVTQYDQNVQVHLPFESIATTIEDTALTLLCNLLHLTPSHWPHRTFTTGATASNILGLACGREYVIDEASANRTDAEVSVGEVGIAEAMRHAGIDKIQILTTVPHSSLSKAASVLGLGRACVKNVGLSNATHKFDMKMLKSLLLQPGSASIVVISASEVNTGLFATNGLSEMKEIRRLCDMYGAWIHVDGAFGLFARILSANNPPSVTTTPYHALNAATEGIELADSLTGDLHKLLNVPYDCGFFLSRHASLAARVFQNANAAYLSTGATTDAIMSPLNIGIENSRRFRALPVYATLVAYGRDGYRDMLERQVGLARGIAKFLLQSMDFELLPEMPEGAHGEEALHAIFMIVLFRARNEALNSQLVERIKATRRIYVSGTVWKGKPACRFAVANWQVQVKRDLRVIEEVLGSVVEQWHAEQRGEK